MDMALPSNTKPSLPGRLNLRLITLLAVLTVPFLYFGYVIINQAVTSGIQDHGDYLEVDLKSLGYFPFDPVEGTMKNVPEKFRALDGKRVMFVGEMYAPSSAGGKVRDFELVYSIAKCCFGGPPKVQERVYARVPDGKPMMPYYYGMVRVIGTLHVKVEKEAGQVTSIYRMDVEKIERA